MLYLKIPNKEISKSNNSETFWTIRPILIRKLKTTSINNDDIIKWKENTFITGGYCYDKNRVYETITETIRKFLS